jgi:predicted enzyme related to lactoylglutathione lyase
VDLAKDCLDVALFTDRADVPAFWRDTVGLTLDHILAVRRGHDQYRFDLSGSVLKVNVIEHGLPAHGASTITAVQVTDAARAGTSPADPDGTSIRFVAPGGETEQIGIRFDVADLSRTMTYYTTTLGWERLAENAVRCGRTMLRFDERPALAPAPNLPVRGWGYITVQIRDCDAEHAAVLAGGGVEGAPAVTMGDVARFSMVRDPDGNWLELSQRASLTGPLPGVRRRVQNTAQIDADRGLP